MLERNEILKVRELLNESQNPLFFFDNDSDGLASFLLLRRFINRGKGVVIKSYPSLSHAYISKVNEFNPDFIFILDKPLIDKDFLSEVLSRGIKVVWIDHHPLDDKEIKEIIKNIFYFNPLFSPENPSNEPVSYWCYKIVDKKEDAWISLIGCVGDWFTPEFYQEVSSQYPDLLPPKVKDAPTLLFSSGFGKLIKLVNLALKDKTTNVMKMLKFLYQIKSPKELMEENEKTKSMYSRYNQISRKYEKLMEKAKNAAKTKGKLLFFQYSGDLALSGELANELYYLFPQKMIVVSYVNGEDAKLSIRGSFDVREITRKAIEKTSGRSGGHKNACAAILRISELELFKEEVLKQLKDNQE